MARKLLVRASHRVVEPQLRVPTPRLDWPRLEVHAAPNPVGRKLALRSGPKRSPF